jgi:hypothetical protein
VANRIIKWDGVEMRNSTCTDMGGMYAYLAGMMLGWVGLGFTMTGEVRSRGSLEIGLL